MNHPEATVSDFLIFAIRCRNLHNPVRVGNLIATTCISVKNHLGGVPDVS